MTPHSAPADGDVVPESSSARLGNIFGTGEMADLTRAYDWSHTPVGPVDQWPEALLITVNTLLCSRHPMFLWWGEELIQFYNDAYRPSIREDKHPGALGQRGQECWPEIWHLIGPQIEAVMSRGEAKRKLEHKQDRIDDEMATVRRTFAGVQIEGIVSNHTHVPLDECAHVYKDLDGVLAVLEKEGIARVEKRLYPVANIKGAD